MVRASSFSGRLESQQRHCGPESMSFHPCIRHCIVSVNHPPYGMQRSTLYFRFCHHMYMWDAECVNCHSIIEACRTAGKEENLLGGELIAEHRLELILSVVACCNRLEHCCSEVPAPTCNEEHPSGLQSTKNAIWISVDGMHASRFIFL